LRRRLHALERRKGKGFVPRKGAGVKAHMKVTIPWLRQHMPELFPRRDEAAETIKEEMAALWEEARESRERDERIVGLLGALGEAAAGE
jgi:hypothetical protein